MRLFRTFLALLALVCFSLLLFSATAENLLTVDMLHSSSYLHALPNLLDEEKNTLWTSAKGGEQYLQIAVPEGDTFTLTLQWGRVPKRLQLMREQDGGWVEIYAHAYDEELPERFLLSPGGQTYRLVAQGTLSIAEMSLAEGELAAATAMPTSESTATASPTSTDMSSPTTTPTEAPTATPLSTSVPTPSPSPSPTPTATPIATPAPPTSAPLDGALFTDMPFSEDDAGAFSASPLPREEAPLKPEEVYDASALLAYLQSKVGKGYLDGCRGEQCTLALRAEKAQRYPERADNILGIAAKWDGQEVYDGIGLLAGFLDPGNDMQPIEDWQSDLDSTLAQWNLEPEMLASMPHTPGILLLHKKEDGGYDRIGVYTGDGRSVHARGYAYGIVEEEMPYVWTHWAMPEWLHFDLAEEQEVSFPAQYLAPGTTATVDSRDGEVLVLYTEPAEADALVGTGYGILNHTLVDIEEAPEADSDWRKISYTDKNGTITAGYVLVDDLRVPAK